MEKNEIFPINGEPKNSQQNLETQSEKIKAWRNDPKIRMFLFTNLKNVSFKIYSSRKPPPFLLANVSSKIGSDIIRKHGLRIRRGRYQSCNLTFLLIP